MQERYLGDIHDYFKFLFLKFLSAKLDMKVGLNWYLVNPEEIGFSELKKKDGEKRKFLYNKELKLYDKIIVNEFKKFQNKQSRNLNLFTRETHLRKYVNFFNEPIHVNSRKEWLQRSLYHHRNQQIIFLDPDNGFAINKTGKISIKYVLAEDCRTYLRNNKIIIFCQFQSLRKKTLDHLKCIFNDLNNSNIKTFMPVIRNRTGPNTFFISIKPKQIKINLEQVLEKYSQQFSKVELIEVV